MPGITTTLPVEKFKDGRVITATDEVVREVPVTIFLNDEELVTLVCSPDQLEELAVGFLCAENILHRREDLKGITVNREDGLIWVETAGPSPQRQTFMKRYLTTCCGRGRSSFYFVNDARSIPPVNSKLQIEAVRLLDLERQLEASAATFGATGGTHGAALCSSAGILLFYEDIGRHNAVDKIFGRCFLDGLALNDKILAFSGRISSEILIKVARMGIPVLVSRGAPTDLALAMAAETGITVAGFARGDRMNVYTGAQRIIFGGQ
ncbi:formate dehydrogenase accessory sulfurtransferase FdhD [Desulfotomaculum copahuensis]|uniref:Sulfur carrier protein FdhD n=1 Tax=Desulfotomaculum copahuensis TaxID=1838280 RepID=A0A1B7LFH0_9FIRM|nr:formate dehydrogenase accessory sulfurtransferase FdhD [Desulfotomaculum copahuensis]OAT82387.1 sufurtransferase FdhD [Desulfotomaculum copahuensis]